jgi:hypothetical protein
MLGFSLFLVINVLIVFVAIGGQSLEQSVPAYRSILMAAFAILWLYRIINHQKEKWDRFHVLLPIPLRVVSLARVLFMILFWLVIAGLFLFSNILVGGLTNTGTFGWHLLTTTSFILMVNAGTFLQRDIYQIVKNKAVRLLIGIVWIGLLLFVYMLFALLIIPTSDFGSLDFIRILFHKTLLTSLGSILFFIVGLVFTLLSCVLYVKRSHYLE